MRLGVIADTHGLMRPEALVALEGVDLILHAGDVGKSEVLRALEDIAPVVAIRGNVDRTGEVAALPKTVSRECGGVRLHMIHDVKTLAADPSAEGWDVVISGHSHKPVVSETNGILWLNPGAAGPRRFRLPVSVAHLEIGNGRAEARLIELSV